MSSYNRQTQSKAQNETNARTLRALVKQPDNKVCADCKRNDPRWASWNIGCFLCIRCSGIHRSMGTHISKVKSIDLDIWTPEQMASVQQWGNKRCNLYWEAHLKAGHIPPDHKVENFIRSKYETKRWAMDGPVPADPSVLDGGSTAAAAAAAAAAPVAAASSAPATSGTSSTSVSQHTSRAKPNAIDLLGGDIGSGAATTSVSRPNMSGASLLDEAPPSTARVSATSSPASTAKPPAAVSNKTGQAAAAGSGGGGGLFDLDWHAGPTSPSTAAPPKGNKSDILSLYSATSPRANTATANASGLDAFGGLSLGGGSAAPLSAANDPWTQPMTSPTQTSANRGPSVFSAQDVWGSNTQSQAPAPAQASNDIWGDMMSGSTQHSATTTSRNQSSNNDAFADIWK